MSSPTGLVPYIKDGSQKITDSEKILDYLSKKYKIVNKI